MDGAGLNKFQKTYQDGEIIFCEIETGVSFYFIKTGTVKLFKMLDGKESMIDILGGGSFFGEMAVIESAPRSATAIASGKVNVLEFSRDNFESVILQNPQMVLRLIKTFVDRINSQKQRLHIFSFKNTTARIIACLLNLRVLEKGNRGIQRVVKSSIDDISKWVRFPSADVNKVLQNLANINVVSVQESKIIILNEDDLKRKLTMYSNVNTITNANK